MRHAFAALPAWLALPASLLLLSGCATTPFQARELSGSIALPAGTHVAAKDSLVRQRLMDVSGSGGATSLLGEQFINNPKQFPVRYALQYDGQAVRNGAHYELNTEVYAAGQLRLSHVIPLTASEQGLPATQDIQLKPTMQ